MKQLEQLTEADALSVNEFFSRKISCLRKVLHKKYLKNTGPQIKSGVTQNTKNTLPPFLPYNTKSVPLGTLFAI
jgi:hypothetical protein